MSSPVVAAGTALAVLAAVPDSRRVAASAAYITGVAAGASPSEPGPNQDDRFAPIPLIAPDAAAAGGAAAVGERSPAAVDTSAAVDWGICTRATSDETLLPAAGVLSELWRLGVTAAGVPPRTEESEAEASEAEASEDADAPFPRPDRRAEVLAFVEDPAAAEADESGEPEPLDPAEPEVSASANGIAEKPDPTPRATASAPTRPTYLAWPDFAAAGTRRSRPMLRTFTGRGCATTELDSDVGTISFPT